jgi:hypothetical protein
MFLTVPVCVSCFVNFPFFSSTATSLNIFNFNFHVFSTFSTAPYKCFFYEHSVKNLLWSMLTFFIPFHSSCMLPLAIRDDNSPRHNTTLSPQYNAMLALFHQPPLLFPPTTSWFTMSSDSNVIDRSSCAPNVMDSISVVELCRFDNINSDIQQLSCECISCPTTTLNSSKLVSFSSGGSGPPFLAQIKCKLCPSSAWNICVECKSSTNKLSTPRQVTDHIRHAHHSYYEEFVRQRKRRRDNPSPLVDNPHLNEAALPIFDALPPTYHQIVQSGVSTPLCSGLTGGDEIDSAAIAHDSEDDTDCAGGPEDQQALDLTDPRFPPLSHPFQMNACGHLPSRDFFFRDKTDGHGMRFLAARAQFGLSDIAPDQLNSLETKMMMQTAELACSLPQNDRDRLAHYTKTVCDVVKNQTLESLDVEAGRKEYRSWTLLPITTPFEMRRQMKDGSKDSMMHNVPHANVMEVGSHAVSLPSDCLQDLMGHGFPLDFVPNGLDAACAPEFPVTDIASSATCRKLFDMNQFHDPVVADYNVWIFEWSDDFEPNTSLTKSNRGGVWVKTITIGPPGSRSHQLTYTYPIAMGPKNCSHEEAEVLIRDDLLKLARPEGIVIYSKKHGGFVRIRAKLFVSLQDQPERRGENHLTGGSSDLHRRFGFSFPWQDFEEELRPCGHCRDVLFDKTLAWVVPQCVDCTNFAHDLSHPLLHLAPPDDELEDELQFRHPGLLELSYGMLNDAASLAHEQYVDGLWTDKNVHKWLKIHCIKEATGKLLLRHADKCKEYADVMGDPGSSDALKAAVLMEKERNPELYSPWPHPAVWNRGVHLNQHPDIPMHLLCLGVVKLLLLRVDKWLSKKQKARPFLKQMKGMLESIQELNLSWLPILPYKGGKFGGWVSENYLTMSRLLCWFYSALDEIAADQEVWVEPDRPMKDWTGDDCKNWLGQRGLVKTGYAHEVRERVSSYRLLPANGQPVVVEQRGGPVETVQLTVEALDDMMALLMVEQVDDESYYTEMERTIRVFLTRFADMEENLSKRNALPSWLSSFNCLCLLNLPDIVRRYGPIRNIWEGSWAGEGFLRFAKPSVTHGLRKHWERSTMNSLMRRKGLEVLVGCMQEGSANPMMESDEEDGFGHPKPVPGLYKCYRGTREMDACLRKGNKVISCLVVRNRLGVACRDALGMALFVPLTIGQHHRTKMGRHYFKFERDQELACTPFEVEEIMEVGVLLPLIQLCEYEDHLFIRGSYTMVDRSHRHLDREGNLTGVRGDDDEEVDRDEGDEDVDSVNIS